MLLTIKVIEVETIVVWAEAISEVDVVVSMEVEEALLVIEVISITVAVIFLEVEVFITAIVGDLRHKAVMMTMNSMVEGMDTQAVGEAATALIEA